MFCFLRENNSFAVLNWKKAFIDHSILLKVSHLMLLVIVCLLAFGLTIHQFSYFLRIFLGDSLAFSQMKHRGLGILSRLHIR